MFFPFKNQHYLLLHFHVQDTCWKMSNFLSIIDYDSSDDFATQASQLLTQDDDDIVYSQIDEAFRDGSYDDDFWSTYGVCVDDYTSETNQFIRKILFSTSSDIKNINFSYVDFTNQPYYSIKQKVSVFPKSTTERSNLSFKNEVFQSASHARNCQSEYGEYMNKFHKSRQSGRHYIFTCGGKSGDSSTQCNFICKLKPFQSTKKYVCTEFRPQSNCTYNPKSRQRQCNFLSYELAPVLYHQVRKNLKVSSATSHAILYPDFLANPPSDTFVRRCRDQVVTDIIGNVEEQGSMLLCVKKYLESKGHKLNVLECNKSYMRNIIIEKAKKDHAIRRKNEKLKKGDIGWDFHLDPNLFSKLDKDFPDEDTKFIYGYDLVTASGIKLAPKLLEVKSSDAAHLRGPYPGTVFGTWGTDSNFHIVCLSLSVYYDNECKETWTRHLTNLRNEIPCIDNNKSIIIADGDKGFKTSFDSIFQFAKKNTCYKHKKDNLCKYGSKGDCSVYYQCVTCTSNSKLQFLKSQYSAKGGKYMEKTPDSELYLISTSGMTCGKMTSQMSESANNFLLPLREGHISYGLILFIEQEQNRMLSNKNKALANYASGKKLVPKMEIMLKKR